MILRIKTRHQQLNHQKLNCLECGKIGATVIVNAYIVEDIVVSYPLPLKEPHCIRCEVSMRVQRVLGNFDDHDICRKN